jgi:hypothetical protein
MNEEEKINSRDGCISGPRELIDEGLVILYRDILASKRIEIAKRSIGW